MPSYSFLNKETSEEFDMIISNSEREELLKTNPHIIQTIKKANFVTSLGGIKPADGFRDILKTIKKTNPGSNIDTY